MGALVNLKESSVFSVRQPGTRIAYFVPMEARNRALFLPEYGL